ncbi:hypothetical protein C8R44DRAFT_858762, partial [Mycena epipterygia]
MRTAHGLSRRRCWKAGAQTPRGIAAGRGQQECTHSRGGVGLRAAFAQEDLARTSPSRCRVASEVLKRYGITKSGETCYALMFILRFRPSKSGARRTANISTTRSSSGPSTIFSATTRNGQRRSLLSGTESSSAPSPRPPPQPSRVPAPSRSSRPPVPPLSTPPLPCRLLLLLLYSYLPPRMIFFLVSC